MSAQSLLVPEHIWIGFGSEQQRRFKESFEVRLVPLGTYGMIVDGQTIDKSRPGNSAGSQFGAEMASAAYVDRAFRGSDWNYSAKTHVAITLLGALAGSIANAPPVPEFHTRYFVRLPDGSMILRDERTESGFRIPPGTCVELMPFRITNQGICEASREGLLSVLAARGAKEHSKYGANGSQPLDAPIPKSTIIGVTVRCKLGNAAPMQIEKMKCLEAGGSLLDD